MVFSRKEYWSGLPFPSPGHFPDPGIEPGSLALQADPLVTELGGKPEEGEELNDLARTRSCFMMLFFFFFYDVVLVSAI